MIERSPDPEHDEQRYLGLTGGQLNGAFLAVVGAVVAGVCAWLFLLGGINTVTGKKETDQTAFVAQQTANRAILTLADLPEGWKARLPDNEEEEVDFEFSQGCKVLDQFHPTSEIANASSDDLYGPAQQKINSDASVFSANPAAGEAFATVTDAMASCREEMLAAFKEVIFDSAAQDGVDPNTLQLNATFDQVPPPALGEASGQMFRFVASMQVDGQPVSFTIDFLSIQHGRMVGGLVYTAINSSPNAEDEQHLAGLAAAKLVAASALLPEA